MKPEFERTARALYGSEVQSMADLDLAGAQRQELIAKTGPAPTMAEYVDACAQFIEKSLGVPVVITVEDKQRAAIIEACHWLRAGAPGRALAVLEAIL